MKENKAAQRKKEILEASFEVFAEKGYHATKISDIAEKLNIGHGTFYRYFKNKLDIFSEVVDQLFIKIIDSIVEEKPDIATDLLTYREQINRIGDKMFDVFVRDHRIAKILFYEVLGVHPEINEKFERVLDFFDKYTEQYFVNGINKGFLKPDLDTLMIARAVNSLIFATARDGVLTDDPEAVIKRWKKTIILLMLDGMAKK